MEPNYKAFTDRMIQKYEGGYGWNKKDPGGPTKYGITCYDLAQLRGQKMDSMTRWAPLVQAMPLSDAEAIYRFKYASAIRFDDLPTGIDCCMMDYAVNSGVSRPILVASRICKVTYTGHFDDVLMMAIKAMGAEKFINAMCDERLTFMHSIRGGSAWKEFGGGWQARVDDLRRYCLAIRSLKVAAPAPDLAETPTPKATNTAPSVATPATGGIAAGSLAAFASGVPHWMVIGGFVAGIAGLIGYELWRKHLADAANNTVVLPQGV